MIRHGLSSSYSDLGCRCAECREAFRVYSATMRNNRYAKTAANGGIAPTDWHGHRSTYVNWGCRCAPCVAAKKTADAARNAQRRQQVSA